jgi:hypothetical protein
LQALEEAEAKEVPDGIANCRRLTWQEPEEAAGAIAVLESKSQKD